MIDHLMRSRESEESSTHSIPGDIVVFAHAQQAFCMHYGMKWTLQLHRFVEAFSASHFLTICNSHRQTSEAHDNRQAPLKVKKWWNQHWISQDLFEVRSTSMNWRKLMSHISFLCVIVECNSITSEADLDGELLYLMVDNFNKFSAIVTNPVDRLYLK